jgi:hypothetical protein
VGPGENGMKRRSIRVALAAGLIAVLVGGVTILLQHQDSLSPRLLLPRRGETLPEQLPNGRPVFVARHEDGSVDVVDAFSPHAPWGIKYLLAWCPSSRTFVDPFHGSVFNEYGHYVLGPAPTGLPSFRTAASTEAGAVDIGVLGPPPQRTPHARPGLQGQHCAQDNASPPDASAPGLVLVDLSALKLWESPRDALASPHGAWVKLEGTLVVPAIGAARLCRSADEESCVTVLGVDHGFAQGRQGERSGIWLARVAGDELVGLTLATLRPPSVNF